MKGMTLVNLKAVLKISTKLFLVFIKLFLLEHSKNIENSCKINSVQKFTWSSTNYYVIIKLPSFSIAFFRFFFC